VNSRRPKDHLKLVSFVDAVDSFLMRSFLFPEFIFFSGYLEKHIVKFSVEILQKEKSTGLLLGKEKYNYSLIINNICQGNGFSD
jgi:hypothetical protein